MESPLCVCEQSIFSNKDLALALMWKFGFPTNSIRKVGDCFNENAYCSFLKKIKNAQSKHQASNHKYLLNSRDLSIGTSAENNYDTTKKEFDKCEREVWYIGTEVSSLRSQISSLSMSSEYDLYGSELSCKKSSLSSAEFRLNNAKDKRDKAETVMNKYKERLDEIKKMTRKDLLTRFKYVVNLAMDGDDIFYMGKRFSYTQFDPDSFIQNHPIMTKGSY